MTFQVSNGGGPLASMGSIGGSRSTALVKLAWVASSSLGNTSTEKASAGALSSPSAPPSGVVHTAVSQVQIVQSRKEAWANVSGSSEGLLASSTTPVLNFQDPPEPSLFDPTPYPLPSHKRRVAIYEIPTSE